jgi:hypothetical protein
VVYGLDKDQMIPPPAGEFMAKSMDATVHAAMASHPKDLANLIAEAARSIGVSASLSPR